MLLSQGSVIADTIHEDSCLRKPFECSLKASTAGGFLSWFYPAFTTVLLRIYKRIIKDCSSNHQHCSSNQHLTSDPNSPDNQVTI